MRVLVTTVPFGQINPLPLEMLHAAGCEVVINPYGKRLSEDDLVSLAEGFDVIVAGTEPITKRVLDHAPNLRLIARVGIGLDGVDLNAARLRGVKVTYTPDAPSPAVAELTIALMLSLLRRIPQANHNLHSGTWVREFGKRIPEVTIGIIGVGRIGARVIRRLAGFGSPRILANDIQGSKEVTDKLKIEWVGKKEIYEQSDIISLHCPLTPLTHNMITLSEIELMRSDVMIVNTARGGLVNEKDLAYVLANKRIAGAAIDVFEKEPYSGPLQGFPECLLTSHMGSMTIDCRARMEIEAVQEVVNFAMGKPLHNEVPEFEYENQTAGNG